MDLVQRYECHRQQEQEEPVAPYTVGNESPYTPKFTLNLGAQNEKALGDSLNGFVRADYRLTGPTWFHTVQNQERSTVFTGLIPISAVNFLPADTGNANYSKARRKSFGVLDKAYANEVIPAIEFGGSFISPGAGRLIGLEAGFKF